METGLGGYVGVLFYKSLSRYVTYYSILSVYSHFLTLLS